MITNISNRSDIMSYLIEAAKTGNIPDPMELRQWMPDLEINESENKESIFYQILSAQMTIEKGASEPIALIPSFTEPPSTEDLESVSIDILSPIKICLAYKDWTTIEEILRILKSQKKIMHPMALPILLDHCQNQLKLHQLLQQTLGKRSLWLASMQNRWNWWTEINSSDINIIHQDNQLAWTLIQYKNGHSNPDNVLYILSTKDKKTVLELMASDPRSLDEEIARDMLHVKSAPLQYLATLILLKLNTIEKKEIQTMIGEYCQNNIREKRGRIFFNAESKDIEEKINTNMLNLFRKENNTKNPLFGIVALHSPEFIFRHLTLSKEEIIHQLIYRADLKDLFQITINSASNYSGQSDFGETLLLLWTKTYPEENTTEVIFTTLLERLSYEGTQRIIEALLASKDDEYFIEKLTIIISGIEHYVKKDLSIRLVEKIFNLIGHRISRTDSNHLLEVLPHMQYILDPRVYNTIVSHWQEVDYRHQKLGEILWEFRNIMKLRRDILTIIIN